MALHLLRVINYVLKMLIFIFEEYYFLLIYSLIFLSAFVRMFPIFSGLNLVSLGYLKKGTACYQDSISNYALNML